MSSRWHGLLLLLLALVTTGCVYRRMTILSEPPGARVFINNVEVGTTPCNVPTNAFIDHGNYKITLFKDGFEPYEVLEPVPPQWYEYPGIDFLAEVGPFVQRDRRVFTYQLQPMREKSGDELKQQADEFRQRGGGATGMPIQPSTIAPAGVSPPPAITAPSATQSPPPVRGPGNERQIPVPPQ
ncbi:MAG TPA: PEGA domain-containing protein [Gemmatales bacterium]|nr:PEGA domain-containing protein [Gemmatales bacterium]